MYYKCWPISCQRTKTANDAFESELFAGPSHLEKDLFINPQQMLLWQNFVDALFTKMI
jgi:hypothetical protein